LNVSGEILILRLGSIAFSEFLVQGSRLFGAL
jgi:hypothetical protein